jgi:hypothetical protein
MADKRPSPMLVHLNDALEQVLPESVLPRLNAHDQEIARTSGHHDLHRCFRCAEWAVDLLSARERSHLRHLVHRLEEVVYEAYNGDWAVEFGLFVSHAPVLDIELSWVDDAVTAAAAVADKVGWDAVPWEELLVELIAMEPRSSEK